MVCIIWKLVLTSSIFHTIYLQWYLETCLASSIFHTIYLQWYLETCLASSIFHTIYLQWYLETCLASSIFHTIYLQWYLETCLASSIFHIIYLQWYLETSYHPPSFISSILSRFLGITRERDREIERDMYMYWYLTTWSSIAVVYFSSRPESASQPACSPCVADGDQGHVGRAPAQEGLHHALRAHLLRSGLDQRGRNHRPGHWLHAAEPQDLPRVQFPRGRTQPERTGHEYRGIRGPHVFVDPQRDPAEFHARGVERNGEWWESKSHLCCRQRQKVHLVGGHSGVWYSVSLNVFSEELQNFTLEVLSVMVSDEIERKSYLCCSQRQKVHISAVDSGKRCISLLQLGRFSRHQVQRHRISLWRCRAQRWVMRTKQNHISAVDRVSWSIL